MAKTMASPPKNFGARMAALRAAKRGGSAVKGKAKMKGKPMKKGKGGMPPQLAAALAKKKGGKAQPGTAAADAGPPASY